MKRKLLIGIGVVIVVIILIALILPHFIDANQYKPMLESQMTEALGGRKVSIGNISISLLPGAAADIDNLSIADDPAFSKSPFLNAKELKVGVNLMPLIFSKKLEVRSFTIVEPQVSLLRNSSGAWNFSTLSGSSSGGSKASPKTGDSSAATNLTVGELTISNGKLTVGTVGSRVKPQTYDNVNVEATDISYTAPFPFKFKAKAPGGGSIALDGKIGPINATDASLSPLDAKVEVDSLDLAATGFVNPSAGLGGIMNFKGTASSDGRQANSKGSVKIDKLKAAANGTPASVPVNVDYATDYDLKKQTGNLTQGDVHIGKALAHLTGAYNTAGETTSLQMKLNGEGMPVPDLEGVLPAVGVSVPSGSKLQSGTLNLNLAITGPVDKLVITGPVNMSNAKLAGFSMGSKLGALGSFAGLGGGGGGSDTEIQTLSANLRVEPSGTHAQNLNIVIPTIGTITGDAKVSSDNKLDCKMVAKLSGGAGGALGQATSGFGLLGGGGKSGGGGGGIPFRIEGTTSNPIFVPDVAGMATSMAKGQAAGALGNAIGGKGAGGAVGGALGGLLGGKNKQQ